MRPFKTTISTAALFIAALCAAFLVESQSLRAAEVSFAETYVEKLTPDTDVIWSGSSTLNITLPWNGFDINEITGDTEISIFLGDFQFDRVLDGADDYDEGERSARFTETDFDNNGNPVSVLLVDVSWNTKTFTISGVFRNYSNAGSDPNFFGVPSRLGISGTFEETNQLDVAWGSFSASHPVAVSGRNSIARRIIDEVEYELNNIQLSGSAELPPTDLTPPTVSISSPAANARLLTSVITGKASDDVAVSEVLYRLGEDEFAPASGTTSWAVDLSTNLSLQPGTNVVEVKSVDQGGNESPVLRRTFFFVVTAPITIEVNNPAWGTTSITNNQQLDLNRTYSITAIPAPGYLFFDWTGDVNSQNATINFLMSSNLLLQPNFVPNPFISVKGTYNGLFSDVNGVTPASAGFFTATVKESGAFSGRILLGGATHSLTGTFKLDGQAGKTILRRGKPSLQVHLQINFDGSLSGTLTQDAVVSDLLAELAQASTNSAKTNYTMLIPPSNDPALAPGGYGFGKATLDTKGKLRFLGTLGDGTSVRQLTMLSQNGRWPFYSSLYASKGVLLGWLSFVDEIDSDFRGDVTWVKSPGARGKYYTNGFALIGTAIGSIYAPPAQSTNSFNSTNPTSGTLEFSGGNLSMPLTNTFLLKTNNLFAITSTNKTVLSVVRANGLIHGRFVHPDTKRNVALRGAILQKAMLGGGFLLGTNQSGAFLMSPAEGDNPN